MFGTGLVTMKKKRTLKPKLNSRIQLEFGINMLLKRTEDLHLEELNGIRSVLYDLDEDGFPDLEHLHIQSSSEIECVINTIEWVPNSTFSNLESLFLHNLINLKEICHGQLPAESFCNLRTVEVNRCDRLKKMFSFSMARILLQLQEIDITECKIMDEIFADGRVKTEDNNEIMNRIMFPQLRYLTLQRLPELVSFCSNTKTMPSTPFRRQKLFPTDSGSEDVISEGENYIPIPLINKKVVLPILEFLKLSELSKLNQIWHGQPSFESCNLRHLVVEKCAVLLNVVSSNLLQSFQNLEIITIESCESVEQVFDLEGLNCDEEHTEFLSHLAELNIIELPRLRSLLSPSMIPYLMQLRGMEIINCDMMEEIVEMEKGPKEEAIDKIVFPLLSYIILEDLPNLMSFYPGNCTFECPSLKRMTIAGCPELKTFTSKYEGLRGTSSEENLHVPSAPLFNKKVALPNLEELKLSDLFSMKAIWRGQFHAESFCRLRVLKVIECQEILNVFPISSLQNLQNLEELSVDFCSSLEEIFELREVEGEVGHAATLPQLRELRLTRLPKLMHLWKKDSLRPMFQNLMALEVRSCGSLTYLLPSAIAKSLVEIKSISVRDCKMMTEIIAAEKGEATDEATFSQLNYLKLKNLPNLTSFCIGRNSFSFPSLEKLLVKECPKLKTFSNRVLSTPKLKKVQTQKDKWLQGGTTIQHSFIQKAHVKELEEELKLIKNLSHLNPSLPTPPLIPEDNVPPI